MKAATTISVLLALGALAGAARAQSTNTVESLMTSGFTMAGVIPSTAGPGIFLVKGKMLFACFVAETPDSKDITTRYCKQVH